MGRALAVSAVLPPLIAQSGLSPSWEWFISSILAAVIIATQLTGILQVRKTATKAKMVLAMKVSFSLNWLVIALLFANAFVPTIRGIFVFEAALVIFMATEMWVFVRRITTLTGRADNEWDLDRG